MKEGLNSRIASLHDQMIDIAKSGPEGIREVNLLAKEALTLAYLARRGRGINYVRDFSPILDGHRIIDTTPFAVGLTTNLYANLMDMVARDAELAHSAMDIIRITSEKLR